MKLCFFIIDLKFIHQKNVDLLAFMVNLFTLFSIIINILINFIIFTLEKYLVL